MKKTKEKKVPTYLVTYDEIQNYVKQGYEKGKQESIQKATNLSLAVPLMVLRDEFGFGEKRLNKFFECYLDLYDSIDKKYLNIEDILKTLKEETGIEIVERWKNDKLKHW